MQRLIHLLAALILLILVSLPTGPTVQAQADGERCFPEGTGYCITGRFREYWEQNGGLPVFGYPITPAREEFNRDTGQTYLTQWFERARFELHPENAPPYDVLLGRLGDDILTVQQNVDWQELPREAGPQPGCLWFDQTGHNVCDQGNGPGFKSYWESHGLLDPRLDSYGRSLALFGLPLTQPRMATNSSGDTVLTQWFERARFEWHPDQPDDFKVLLGLLGNEYSPGAPATTVVASSYPESLTAIGDTLFFSAEDGQHGDELWKSDGTPEGTRLVRDINPGPASSSAVLLMNGNGTLFFAADDGQHGTELWKSDGTRAGTLMLRDINPGAEGSRLFQFAFAGGTFFFIANDAQHGDELWASDGTPEGTRLVKDIFPGSDGSWVYQGMGFAPYLTTAVGERVFFFANDGTSGAELWTSDGTRNGTRMVRDINPGPQDTRFFELTAANGQLFFVAWDNANGYGLWRSDGTSAGTQLLRAFEPRPRSSPMDRSFPPLFGLTEFNNRLVFTAWDAEHGDELWVSDGTPEGTFLFKNIIPGAAGATPMQFTSVKGMLLFTGTNARGNRELWRSDGTPEGTVPIREIDISGDLVVRPDGTVFFLRPLTDTAGSSFELWKTDATSPGTVPIKAFTTTVNYLGPDMEMLNDTLMLSIADDRHGIELWRSNGTSGGTILVRDIYPGTTRIE
ncbi:MAG: ELWxxDGT repeat protein [Chloroflexaceae bacterium]